MALPIRPELLRELRRRQGLRLHTLAERAGISKDSVWRIENGMQPGNREDTQRRLARALNVEPAMLTGERPLPEVAPVARGRWTVEVSEAARNAAILAARRYRVGEALIVELAPLLFVLAAEESLGRRRALLAQLETALGKTAEAGEEMPHLAGIGEAGEAVRAAVVAEERSVAARDLFARDLDPDMLAALGDGGGDGGADNPLAVFLAENARRVSIGAPDLARVAQVTETGASAVLCGAEALEAAGGDAALAAAIVSGRIALGDMPRALWAGEAARLDWLRDQIKT
ncbi:MAG: helix-turn-helix transcriptional regulator [Rhodospirillales bacterium]|nr:helix-turn-helix transcriptional regulator [Rhodospirillales bacterium]